MIFSADFAMTFLGWWYMTLSNGQVISNGTSCHLCFGSTATTWIYCWNDEFFTVRNAPDHGNIPTNRLSTNYRQCGTTWRSEWPPPKNPGGAPPSTVSAMCYAELWHQKAMFLPENGPFQWRGLSGRWCRYCQVMSSSYWTCTWLMLVNGAGCAMLHRSEVGNGLIMRTSKPGCRLRAFVSRSTSQAAGWGPGAEQFCIAMSSCNSTSYVV